MSDTVLAILITALLTAIVAPLVLSFFSRNKDGTALAQNALTVANQAVADLNTANDAIRELRREIAKVRREKTAPLRVTLDVVRDPELGISNASVMLMEESNT